MTGNAPLGAAASVLPWRNVFVGPSLLSLVGLVVTFVGGLVLVRRAVTTRQASDALPPGKQRPIVTGRGHLPGLALSGLNWSGGIAAKLVFIGTALAATLTATNLLDSILSPNQRVVFAALNIVSVFIVGLGPLAVALIPARYQPTIQTTPAATPVVIGEEQLVATTLGINLGATLTAAGVLMQLGGLWWLANHAKLNWIPLTGLAIVAVAVIAYSWVTIWTLTVTGCLPPMVDTPTPAMHAPLHVALPGEEHPSGEFRIARLLVARPERGWLTTTMLGRESTTEPPLREEAEPMVLPTATPPAERRLLP